MENKYDIQTVTDLCAAVIATVFTPIEVANGWVKYDKETMLLLAQALSEAMETWYNVTLDEEMTNLIEKDANV